MKYLDLRNLWYVWDNMLHYFFRRQKGTFFMQNVDYSRWTNLPFLIYTSIRFWSLAVFYHSYVWLNLTKTLHYIWVSLLDTIWCNDVYNHCILKHGRRTPSHWGIYVTLDVWRTPCQEAADACTTSECISPMSISMRTVKLRFCWDNCKLLKNMTHKLGCIGW